ELLRIDVCGAVVFGMTTSNPLMSVYFHKRFLALALRAGEPHRVLRGLLLEVAFAAAAGGGEAPTRSASTSERTLRSLIERLRGSGARFAAHEGAIELVWGVNAMFRSRFGEARGHFTRALSWCEGNGVRVINEFAHASMLLVQVLCWLGEWKEITRLLA